MTGERPHVRFTIPLLYLSPPRMRFGSPYVPHTEMTAIRLLIRLTSRSTRTSFLTLWHFVNNKEDTQFIIFYWTGKKMGCRKSICLSHVLYTRIMVDTEDYVADPSRSAWDHSLWRLRWPESCDIVVSNNLLRFLQSCWWASSRETAGNPYLLWTHLNDAWFDANVLVCSAAFSWAL